jgi:hypothetical protein
MAQQLWPDALLRPQAGDCTEACCDPTQHRTCHALRIGEKAAVHVVDNEDWEVRMRLRELVL